MPRTHCDEIFKTIVAEVLNRKLVFIPCYKEDGHGDSGEIVIIPKNPTTQPPFYFMMFPEWRFGIGHYQSIR